MARKLLIAVLFALAALLAWNAWWEGGPVNRQALAGKQVYAERCWSCHDIDGGSGPHLTDARVGSYGTARALFDYTRMSMPFDAPGTLTDEQYWDVTAYLALTRGRAEPGSPLGPATADAVRLVPPPRG